MFILQNVFMLLIICKFLFSVVTSVTIVESKDKVKMKKHEDEYNKEFLAFFVWLKIELTLKKVDLYIFF